MEFQEILENIRKQAGKNAPIGNTVKFIIDDNFIFVDGRGDENVVTEHDSEAACTLKVSVNTLSKIVQGDLNPMMATMTGKIKISGDMGIAMKLGSLI